MKPSTNKITAFLVSLLISFGFAACCLKIPSVSATVSSLGNLNLLTYAMTVILFCVSYLVLCLVTNRTKKKSILDNPSAAFALSAVLFAGNLIFLAAMYILETNVYGSVSARYIWHTMPLWLVMLALACGSLFFLAFIRKTSVSVRDHALFPLYGILTVLAGYNFYTPAVFLRDEPDRLHMDAYFNSVYNVLHGSPYTENTTSIYGHYAILYKLPMKLLGGDLIDFILLNSMIGALCFLAAFLALHFMVKNNVLRFLGAVAMTFPVLAMRSGIYWQLWPHRILFMSLMLCYAAFCVRYKKLSRIFCILGYLLSFIAILWNTESGIFCAAAWAGFWILRLFCDKTKNTLSLIRGVLVHLAGIILAFLGAYAVVELYNIQSEGTVTSIREFLFPLLQSSYMDDLLRVDLPYFPSAYMVILILFFLAAAWGISHMRWLREKQDILSSQVLIPCFAFLTAVLSLGQITYFINRAAYHNLEICHLPAVLLLCIFAEKGFSAFRSFRLKNLKGFAPQQIFYGAFTTTALIVLLTVCTGNLIQYGLNTGLRAELHDKTDITDFAAHVAANIPENTYAFGIGVPEIYAILRWDTQCYTLDLADLSLRPQAGDYIMDDIREKDLPGFLAGEGTMERLGKYSSKEKYQWIKDNYKISQTFEFKGAVLRYFTKK
ncbi:MAG TPA: hypothetical protein IAA26_07575 [Candidatus Blautia faecipullorum]|nr:hypothetical protein [Candidatus Blautia faecipullorum]